MAVHFSVDDFINTLLDLKEETYESVFDQPAFAMLRRVHEACGAVFSCYCFYESAQGTLEEVPERFRNEFQENGAWLRFGFHGYRADSNYGSSKFKEGEWIDEEVLAAGHYKKVMERLTAITGGGECIDRYPRIHYYAGTMADCRAWKAAKNGILGLITAEDDRVCYYHDKAQWETMLEKGFLREEQLGLEFYRTCIRLESMKNMDMLEDALKGMNASRDYLVFTHEKFLSEERIEKYFLSCGQAAEEAGMTLGYFYEKPEKPKR